MSLEQVLGMLADGEVHSGEALGQALGVSRTAVWKQLKKLEDLGISVLSVKGQGYQLPGGMELLQRDKILSCLSERARSLLGDLELHGSIDSTNVRALEQIRSGSSQGFVCLAEHQTAGRGRHGRNWVSPFGRNVYLSLVWEFNSGAAALGGLSLAVGVAIARALQRNKIPDVELKWPNDVLWRGQKLAGILLELTGDAAGRCQVVIGVGVNVGMRAEEASAISQAWASLSDIVPDVSRNKVAGDLLDELLLMLENYEQEGFAALREEWESLHCHANREVEIRAGDNVTVGIALGVNDQGALRLATESGETAVYGGEASLRPARAEAP